MIWKAENTNRDAIRKVKKSEYWKNVKVFRVMSFNHLQTNIAEPGKQLQYVISWLALERYVIMHGNYIPIND